MSAALAIKTADGTTVYLLMASGNGTSGDPYIPAHTISSALPPGTALIGKVVAQGADAAGAAPTQNPLFVAWDGTNVRAIKTDAAGVVQVAFAATPTVNLGTIAGVATASNQTAANGKLDTLLTQTDGIEASLSSIDTKLPASPATSGKQDTGNTALASIDGKLSDVATQTTSAAILAKLIAAPATAANQTAANTSLASIDGKLSAAQTGTVTRAALTTTSSTILAATTNRFGVVLYNDSPATAYVKLGATASATSKSYVLAAGATLEILVRYTGRIDAVLAAGTGNMDVTELS